MSLSPSVAVNGAPRFTPAIVFSSTLRIPVSLVGNSGSSFMLATRIVTLIVSSVTSSAALLSSLLSLTDTVTV